MPWEFTLNWNGCHFLRRRTLKPETWHMSTREKTWLQEIMWMCLALMQSTKLGPTYSLCEWLGPYTTTLKRPCNNKSINETSDQPINHPFINLIHSDTQQSIIHIMTHGCLNIAALVYTQANQKDWSLMKRVQSRHCCKNDSRRRHLRRPESAGTCHHFRQGL